MDGTEQPLWKLLDAPLVALDESHVELFSLLVLFLLTLLALATRGRLRQPVRHLVQLVSIAVFFFVVYSCLGVFGMIRNLLHGVTLIGTVYTESFFWMSLPVVVIGFSVISGPYFCGWICPTGTFQELAAMLRERLGALVRRGRPAPLRPSPVWLGFLVACTALFVGLVFWLGTTRIFYVEDSSLYWGAALCCLVLLVLGGWADDAALRGLRALSFAVIVGSALLKTAIISPVHFAFANVSDPASALTTLVLVVASLFVARGWCRYVCPFGYLMGCLHRVSRLKVVSRPGCEGCNTCAQTCRVGAIQKGRVHTSLCQLCMACVDGCPRGALALEDTWTRPAECSREPPA